METLVIKLLQQSKQSIYLFIFIESNDVLITGLAVISHIS